MAEHPRRNAPCVMSPCMPVSAASVKMSALNFPILERWAAAQDQPVKWYKDKFTGKTMDRPGWNQLEAAIHAGEVSAVVCWRLDRLGRTARGLTALFDDLRRSKVGLSAEGRLGP